MVFDFSAVPYVDDAIVAELVRTCTVRILHGRDPIVVVTSQGHLFGDRDTCLEVAADLEDVACCRTPDIVFECALAATHRRQKYAIGSVR